MIHIIDIDIMSLIVIMRSMYSVNRINRFTFLINSYHVGLIFSRFRSRIEDISNATVMSSAQCEDESEKQLLFTYGTLKQGQPNHHYFSDPSPDHGTARFIGSAVTTTRWPLVVTTRFNLPFLLYSAGHGHIIKGEVFEIDRKMRNFCDEFEWHPTVYTRDKILVNIIDSAATGQEHKDMLTPSDSLENYGPNGKSKTVECWCYFLKRYLPETEKLDMLEEYKHTEFSSYDDEDSENECLEDLGLTS